MSVYQSNNLNEKESSRTLSLIVDNEPGTLARVIGLFSGRGYNIESLTAMSVPFIAFFTPPETGASTTEIQFCFTSSCNSMVCCGWLEDISIT